MNFSNSNGKNTMKEEKPMPKNEAEWKEKLSGEEYAVLREKATEKPFSGKYLNENKEGMYVCKACGNPLFPSDAKFDSDMPSLQGWPSFGEALPGSIKFQEDDSLGMKRTEVTCARCGSHLGHLFNDDESKTGKHFCINSVCLELEEKKK